MPDYDPDPWNTPENITVNNCYNYATNNMNKPKPGKPKPKDADPGRTGKVTAAKAIAIVPLPSGKGLTILFDFECKGVETACGIDGLGKPNATTGKCGTNCWKIAYYARRGKRRTATTPAIQGDYHFVRQDSDGTWSMKPNNDSEPVTQKQYNDSSGKYDGPKITDPEHGNVGPGDYVFCGYLCACNDTKVAGLLPPIDDNADVFVSVVADTAYEQIIKTNLAGYHFTAFIDEIQNVAEGGWQEGIISSNYKYTVDLSMKNQDVAYHSYWISEDYISFWNGFIFQHLRISSSKALERFEKLILEDNQSRISEIMNNKQKIGAAVVVITTVAGGLIAAKLGAESGAAIGSLAGPGGIILGAAVGAVAGFCIGALAGLWS